MNILEEIEKSYNSFAPKERTIAMFIIHNPKLVQSMTITDLAARAHSSIASVTRFCKKMKCANYADFKIKLAVSTANGDAAKQKDPSHTTLTQVNEFYKKVVQHTISSVDESVILHVTSLIANAKRVYVFGIGSSGLTALELQSRLSRMGIVAFACTDGDAMRIATALLGQDDLIISISNSGNTPEIIQSVKIARKNHVQIVSFTSFSQSPLTELSDYTVLVYNSLFLDNESFINTQFSLLYVVDVLSVYLLEDPQYSENMRLTIEAVHEPKSL
ncbi:MurR/RpiR family transcriptional regulator [Lacticaseibacillus parakribbianus]|uniref:MurR/RpiR family transcriptional regulator n=1 Tax=Lacticaseibacillus parakribbianus TaxID=2970927 RepID=UPI0021CAE3C1|nr:MurR/RpiR family transcriptional regulator [Lacticaseibacillus parakribbianus]